MLGVCLTFNTDFAAAGILYLADAYAMTMFVKISKSELLCSCDVNGLQIIQLVMNSI